MSEKENLFPKDKFDNRTSLWVASLPERSALESCSAKPFLIA